MFSLISIQFKKGINSAIAGWCKENSWFTRGNRK